MYGYTLHFPVPIDASQAMHHAVPEVLEEEFTPVVVMTPRAFDSDAVG